MKNLFRVFSLVCLGLLAYLHSGNAAAQTEFTATLHFDEAYNYHANFTSSSGTYYFSMNDGADPSLLRQKFLDYGTEIIGVTVNPHTPTIYQFNIVFQKPMDMERMLAFFNKSHVMLFQCPTGSFHFKDLSGWLSDRLYK